VKRFSRRLWAIALGLVVLVLAVQFVVSYLRSNWWLLVVLVLVVVALPAVRRSRAPASSDAWFG